MNTIELTGNEPLIGQVSPEHGKRLPAAMLPGHFLWKRSRTLSCQKSGNSEHFKVEPDTETFYLDEVGFARRVFVYEGLEDGIYTMTTGVYPNVIEAVKFKVDNGEITLLEAKPNLEAL